MLKIGPVKSDSNAGGQTGGRDMRTGERTLVVDSRLEFSGELKVGYKIEWQESLSTLRVTGDTLRETANRALATGVSRQELVEWGVECGFKYGQMRNLVSKLLRE